MGTMAKIYVASSWRNKYFPEVVIALREAGHEVYDFRNPPHGGNGFRWTDIDENVLSWNFEQYAEGLAPSEGGTAVRGRFGSAGVGGYLRAGTSLWPQRSYGGGLDGRSWEESCRLYS